LIAGLGLTGVGIIDLNKASEPPEPKASNAYGVLSFSSVQCEAQGGGVILQEIDLKKDLVNTKVTISIFLEPPSNAPYEMIFGFQLPGISDQPNFSIIGHDEKKEMREISLFEEKLVNYETEGCALIYARFMAQPNFKYYEIVAQSNLQSLVTKQGFSSYDVSVPFSRTDSYLLATSGLSVSSVSNRWGCSMYSPPGTELKWALPYPDSQESWLPFNEDGTPTSESYTSYAWEARDLGFSTGSGDERADIISVLLELSAESRLQSRLFFDSGLYMGIGVGLIFSGLFELLRVVTRMRGVHGSDS